MSVENGYAYNLGNSALRLGDPAPLLWRYTFCIIDKWQLYKEQELKLNDN